MAKLLFTLAFVLAPILAQEVVSPPALLDFNLEDNFKLLRSGGRFSLTCGSRTRPRPAFKWFKDGQELKTGDLPGIEVEEDKIFFTQVNVRVNKKWE